MSAQLSLLTEIPPEIPGHITWSEHNARRRLYDAYRSRVGEWIPLRPDIVAITRTKHTQRHSDIRRDVLAGTGWIIESHTETVIEHGELVVMSWYRLVKGDPS